MKRVIITDPKKAKTIHTLVRIAVALSFIAAFILLVILSGAGCEWGQTEADKVSYNISLQADNFNVVRRLTVINCIQGDVLFVMEGKMSIKVDSADNQLEITVEDNGTYKKHFVGLSDNVTYTLEDLSMNEVSKYHYTINFNPRMWIPFDFENVD